MNMNQIKYATVITIVTSLFGCIDDKKEENKGYSEDTQIPIEQIVEDHFAIFSEVNYFEKRPGEYIHYRMNTKANTQTSAETIADFETQFNALCETSDEFRVNLAYSYDFYYDEEEAVVQNFTITIPKEESSASQKLRGVNTNSSILPATAKKLQLSEVLTKSMNNLGIQTRATSVSLDFDCVPTDDVACYKFYDFKVEQYKKQAPQAVIEAGCPGLTNCELNVTKQSYKQVVQVKGEAERIITHEMELAPEIPFFDVFFDDFLWNSPTSGPIYNGSVSHCYSSWVTLNDNENRAYIRQCVYTKNFSLGDGEDPCPTN